MRSRDGREFHPQELHEAHSFYPTFWFPVDQPRRFILVVDMDSGDQAFALATELIGAVPVLFVGTPGDDQSFVEAASSTAIADGDVVRIMLSEVQPRAEWSLGAPGLVTPAWVVRAIASVDYGSLPLERLHALQLGYGAADRRLGGVLKNGIPGARYSPGRETTSREVKDLLDRVNRGLSVTPVWEVNYVVVPGIQLFGIPPTVIPELWLVWGTVGLVGIMLLYPIFRPRRSREYFHVILRRAPFLVLMYGALVASLAISNLALRVLLSATAITPSLLILSVGKACVGVLAFVGLIALFHVHFRSRATTVFSAAALLSLAIAALIFSLVSIPVGAYVLAMFVTAYVFSISPWKWLKGVFLVLTVLPLLYLAVSLTNTTGPVITRLVLTPPFLRESLTAVLILPVLLLMIRLDFLTPRIPLLGVTAVFAAIGFVLVMAQIVNGLISPTIPSLSLGEYHEPSGAQVSVATASAAQRNRGAIWRLRRPLTVVHPELGEIGTCDEVPCSVPMDRSVSPVILQGSLQTRLERIVLSLHVTFDQPIHRLELELTTSQPVLIYRSTLPIRQEVGSRSDRVTFQLGASPPEEFDLELVLQGQESVLERAQLDITAYQRGAAATVRYGLDPVQLARAQTVWNTREPAIDG